MEDELKEKMLCRDCGSIFLIDKYWVDICNRRKENLQQHRLYFQNKNERSYGQGIVCKVCRSRNVNIILSTMKINNIYYLEGIDKDRKKIESNRYKCIGITPSLFEGDKDEIYLCINTDKTSKNYAFCIEVKLKDIKIESEETK